MTSGRERPRRALLVLLCALLVVGFVLAGPAHDALHCDAHADGGTGCEACHLAGVELPAGFALDGPGLVLVAREADPRASVRTRDRCSTESARGPPHAPAIAA